MSIESDFNFIDSLNSSFPESSNSLSESDDHHRGTKNAVKGSFPNLGAKAVTLTADQINGLLLSQSPVGSVIMYTGSHSSLPANWAFCDGTGGTIDLRDKFIRGGQLEANQGDTGGSADAVVVSHSHGDGTLGTNSQGDHNHIQGTYMENADTFRYGTGASGGVNKNAGVSGGSGVTGKTDTTGTHTHDVTGTTGTTGVTGTGDNLPPYYTLSYIQRLS